MNTGIKCWMRLVLAVWAMFAPTFAVKAMQDTIAEEKNAAQAVTKGAVSPPAPGALVVPVYPRFKQPETPATIENLKDTYIVLEDGSVLSMADWLLGSLNKSEVGAGVSDFQNRLFLGQVARAAVGLPQNLVYHSYRDAGPLVPFVPKDIPVPLQVTRGLLSYFIPALSPNWSSKAPEFSLDEYAGLRGQSGGAVQFDKQFFDALDQTRAEFVYDGRMMNVAAEYEKNTAKPK